MNNLDLENQLFQSTPPTSRNFKKMDKNREIHPPLSKWFRHRCSIVYSYFRYRPPVGNFRLNLNLSLKRNSPFYSCCLCSKLLGNKTRIYLVIELNLVCRFVKLSVSLSFFFCGSTNFCCYLKSKNGSYNSK